MSAPTLLAPPKRLWTDEQRQEVKALLAKGATAAGVARKMGLNRNQVLGRIYRDPELALRNYSPKPKNSPPRPPRLPKPTSPTSAAVVMVAKAGKAEAEPATAPATTPEPSDHLNAMALIGTGTRWCKWPVARDSRVLGGFLCCGDRSRPNDVYCEHHRDMARVKPTKRAAPV